MSLRGWAGSVAVAVLGTTLAMSGCFVTPEVIGTGGGVSTTTGSGGTGAGGTGGGATCVAAQCPGDDDCNDAVCVDNMCGLKPKPGAPCGDNGDLECDADGNCTGCAGDPAKCDVKECHTVECVGNTCTYTPDASLECGDAANPGTCDASGECGFCNDKIRNGSEIDVDCGPAACGSCIGADCSGNDKCKSGHCVDGRCCNGVCDGHCEGCNATLTGTEDGVCAPLILGTLDDAAMPLPCSDKGGCGLHNVCACEDGEQSFGEAGVDCGGFCTVQCPTGSPCATGDDTDCISGKCVDGFCCNMNCGVSCKRCDQPGFEGLCVNVVPGAGEGCTDPQVCDAEGACLSKSGDCNDDDQCASGLCAEGSCTACAPPQFPCLGTDICMAGFCIPGNLNPGEACFTKEQCKSMSCRDGVCCDKACTGTCMACHTAYTGEPSGTCAPVVPGADPHDHCTGVGPAAGCSGSDENASGHSSCGSLPP